MPSKSLSSLRVQVEKASAEMRLVADLLSSKVVVLPTRTSGEKQVAADLHLLARRLEAIALGLSAEAQAGQRNTVAALAKVGIVVAFSAQAFAGGAGQGFISDWLSEDEAVKIVSHCDIAAASLSIVADTATAGDYVVEGLDELSLEAIKMADRIDSHVSALMTLWPIEGAEVDNIEALQDRIERMGTKLNAALANYHRRQAQYVAERRADPNG